MSTKKPKKGNVTCKKKRKVERARGGIESDPMKGVAPKKSKKVKIAKVAV